MFFAAGCVDPAIIDRMLARPVPERTGAVGYGRYELLADTLEQALTPGPYLLGARFTAADLYIGGQLGFGLMTQSVEPRPVFQALVFRVTERPAYQRSAEQGAALMAAMKAAG